MKTVHILRHLKAKEAEGADEERPLAARGKSDGKKLARHLNENPTPVDLVLSSSSRRTRETVKLLLKALGNPPVEFEDDLYGAYAEDLVLRLKELPDEVDAVLLVGHNPGLEELAQLLAASATRAFPTGALATLRLDIKHWRSLVPDGQARLEAFLVPANLA